MQKLTHRYLSLFLFVCAFVLCGCQLIGPGQPIITNDGPASAQPKTFTILYTNDEHGWMAGEEDSHLGSASIMQLWIDEESYMEDGPFLVLSGGDIWTGPAISSWFDGQSMIEVMNAMGYDAVAIGNHEFDYGISGLEERSAEAEFSFLSANIQQDGEQAAFTLPYVIQTVNGVKVGIIGLSSLATPRTTMPTYVENLTFTPYAPALAEVVPQVKSEGAEVIIVIGHLCSYELITLAPKAAQLGISMLGGGHCHEQFSQILDGVALLEAGSNLRAYGRVDITYDPAAGDVTNIDVKMESNVDDRENPEISAIVSKWQVKIDQELQHIIGYSKIGLPRTSSAMFNMVMDAWLSAYPAEVAISNPGGFRQDLSPGDITLADVVGILPFDNYLIEVHLTGKQLIESVEYGTRQPAIGGMTTKNGYKLADGTPIDASEIYSVLVNNFMYAGGDGYQFAEYDPDAYETGIDWRQPVIDWIIDQRSDQENPLETFIDDTPR